MITDEQFLNWTRGWVSEPLRQEDNDLARDVRLCQLFLYSLVRLTGAQTVLEIGVADGSTTIALLKAAHETGGVVHSVDPSACTRAHDLALACGYWPASAPPASAPPARAPRAGGQAGRPAWRFYRMTSAEFFARGPLGCMPSIDLAFIDGDHDACAVAADITAVLDRLRPGGYCVLHDWNPATSAVCQAHPAPDEFGVIKGLRSALGDQRAYKLHVMPMLPCGPGPDNSSEGAFLIIQKAYDDGTVELARSLWVTQ